MRIIFTLKSSLHWAGSILALASIVFLFIRLHEYADRLDFSRFDLSLWLVIGSFGLIYSLANLMLALAWQNLLGYFGAHIAKYWALKIYGVSQLARYVPGNIFHIASRQAMGLSAGISSWPLAKAAVWELGLIAFAGGIFGCLALPLLTPAIPVALSLGLFLIIIIGIIVLLYYRFSPPLAYALGWYIGFLTISGSLFVGLIEAVFTHINLHNILWIPVGGAYVIAWLAGLVTPGVPAGLGIRELVLLFMLKSIEAEEDLLVTITISRVVTVVGDLSFFLMALLMKRGRGNHIDL